MTNHLTMETKSATSDTAVAAAAHATDLVAALADVSAACADASVASTLRRSKSRASCASRSASSSRRISIHPLSKSRCASEHGECGLYAASLIARIPASPCFSTHMEISGKSLKECSCIVGLALSKGHFSTVARAIPRCTCCGRLQGEPHAEGCRFAIYTIRRHP